MTDRERGLAWATMQRERWGIDPRLQPIGAAGGACAWGVPLTDRERAQSEEYLIGAGRYLRPRRTAEGMEP